MADPQVDAPVQAEDTADLLDRARAGDQEALNRLFARHMPPLKRWASGRLPRWARDIADTTDVVQETVLETVKRIDRFEHRGDGALQAYLRQALLNRIRNHLRRMALRGTGETLHSTMPDAGPSPLDAAMASESLERYEAALAKLGPRDRQAVVSRIEFGLSYAEIAEAIGTPSANAARMTVVRALARLAGEMPPGRTATS